MKINETFKDNDIDGQLIVMRIGDDAIAFGSLFEENIRVNLHGLTGQYRDDRIRMCFDWFRNYATLFARVDHALAWKAYQRAQKQASDSVRHAFWKFIDGYKLRSHGKHFIQYVK